MKVKDAMSKDPVTIDPEAPLRAAADLMRAKGIRHLPVVDGAGSLVGILTDRDLRHAAFVPALAEHLMCERRRLQALKVRETGQGPGVLRWAGRSTASGACPAP